MNKCQKCGVMLKEYGLCHCDPEADTEINRDYSKLFDSIKNISEAENPECDDKVKCIEQLIYLLFKATHKTRERLNCNLKRPQ